MPPTGVATDWFHLQSVEVVIEHGGSFFSQRRLAVVLFFPYSRSVIAPACGAKGYGQGAAEGLHVEEFIAAKTRREIGQAICPGYCGDEIVGHD